MVGMPMMSRMKKSDTAFRKDSPKITSSAIISTRRMGPFRHTIFAPSRRGTVDFSWRSGSFTKVTTKNTQIGKMPITTKARPASTGPVRAARSAGVAFIISPVKALVASCQSAPKTWLTEPPRSAITSMIMGTAAATMSPANTNNSRAAVTRLRW